MSKPVTFRLSRQHEADIHEALGGHQSKSSGNQWHDAADGKHFPYSPFAMAWDCKCVMPETKSFTMSRADIDKITEQARGRVPAIPLRFYGDERGGVEHDWIAVPLEHYLELRDRATKE